MTATYRINDLAHPRLPLPIWMLNRVLAPFTSWVRLDESDLLKRAMRKTGLSDFGDDWFREPLRVLVQAVNRESNLNTLSRIYMRQFLQQLLISRLLVEDLVTRHPEILDLPVPAPIFILGLPRTGTTHLHNLLTCDPGLRWLPYWESVEPLLPPDKWPAPGQPDPRRKRSQQRLR